MTNAGGPPPGTFASTAVDAYAGALDLNLLSIVAMCKAAVPAMQEHLAFLDAVQKRDESRAVGLMAAHIEASRQRVLARATGAQSADPADALRIA